MEMKVFQAERDFQTTGGLHVTDITEEVAEIVRESGVSACSSSSSTARARAAGSARSSGRNWKHPNLEVVSKCAVGCGPNLIRSARVRPAGCCRANQVRVFRLRDALETREPGSRGCLLAGGR